MDSKRLLYTVTKWNLNWRRPANLHNREIDWSVFPENTDERIKNIFNSCERRCLSNDGSEASTLFPCDGFLSGSLLLSTSALCRCNVPSRKGTSVWHNQFIRLRGVNTNTSLQKIMTFMHIPRPCLYVSYVNICNFHCTRANSATILPRIVSRNRLY